MTASLDAPAPRVVGVDYGTKRVGLALADPLRMFARPHGAFTQREAVEELKRIHADEGIETIVVGWPLTLGGEEGVATERVQQYINRLRNALPDAVRIVKRDERLTSEMAKDALRDAGARRTGRIEEDRGRVDAAAAALILQHYLDAAGH
jgi:putative Holliday junction resolvase